MRIRDKHPGSATLVACRSDEGLHWGAEPSPYNCPTHFQLRYAAPPKLSYTLL
jgi:hypothetical protein